MNARLVKGIFIGKGILLLLNLLDRTWSDDEVNPVPPIMRRCQPPTALQNQPAQIASSSSEPQLQTSVKRKERLWKFIYGQCYLDSCWRLDWLEVVGPEVLEVFG